MGWQSPLLDGPLPPPSPAPQIVPPHPPQSHGLPPLLKGGKLLPPRVLHRLIPLPGAPMAPSAIQLWSLIPPPEKALPTNLAM